MQLEIKDIVIMIEITNINNRTTFIDTICAFEFDVSYRMTLVSAPINKIFKAIRIYMRFGMSRIIFISLSFFSFLVSKIKVNKRISLIISETQYLEDCCEISAMLHINSCMRSQDCEIIIVMYKPFKKESFVSFNIIKGNLIK